MSEQEWFGRYRVFECVGSGGMATVHRALIAQGNVELEVALKRLLPHLVEDEHFVRDFIREAKLAANLHHPNIVRVYELGRIEDTYFIAMELVRGTALTTIIRAGRPSPIGPVLALMLELTEALDYAHDGIGGDGRKNQVIHRDLTPSNLLITEEGSLKIIDFGVAKALTGEHATNSGFAKGKLGYMAPEQVEAINIDGRADVYSAGIVMWELLTGGRLFQPKHDLDIGVLEMVAPPPSVFNPDIPAAIDDLVMRALEKDVARRYASASDFHRAVAQAIRPYAGQATRRDVQAWVNSLKPRDHSEDYVGYEVVNESSRLTPPGALPGLTPVPSIPVRSHPRAHRAETAGRHWPAEPMTTPLVEYSQWPVSASSASVPDRSAEWETDPATTPRLRPPSQPPVQTVVPAPAPEGPAVAVRFRPPTVVPPVSGSADSPGVRFRPPTAAPPVDGAPAVRFRPPTVVPPPGPAASGPPVLPDAAPAVRFRPPTVVPPVGPPPPRAPSPRVPAISAREQQEREARAAEFADDGRNVHEARRHDARAGQFAPEPTQSDSFVLEPAPYRTPSADDFAPAGTSATTNELDGGGPIQEPPTTEQPGRPSRGRSRRSSTGMRAPRPGSSIDHLGKPKKR